MQYHYLTTIVQRTIVVRLTLSCILIIKYLPFGTHVKGIADMFDNVGGKNRWCGNMACCGLCRQAVHEYSQSCSIEWRKALSQKRQYNTGKHIATASSGE